MYPKSSCRLKNGFYPLCFMTVILFHRWDFLLLSHQPEKRLCATCVMFLFGAEFGLCVFLCDVQAAFQCGETLPKAACTFEFVEFAFQTAFGWQVRIRAFGLRLNDDSLDSYLLRLPNHLFIRKNDHFPFRIVSFPAARETVMLENIQNIFPNLRHIIIGVTIQ